MNEILNPNCSEVVWRLEVKLNTKEEILKALEPKDEDYEHETFETDGDNYPNGCVNDMMREMDGAIDIDEAEIIYEEDQGREGVREFTDECFEIAKNLFKGEINKDEADRLERASWNNNVEINRGDDEDY